MRIRCSILIFLVVTLLTLNIFFRDVTAQQDSIDDPIIELNDFQNGTKQLIVDYRNGTYDYITETFVRKNARLKMNISDVEQSLVETFPTSIEEATDYINSTQMLTTEQEGLFGFTYTLAYLQKEWNASGGFWIISWYFKVGINVDIEFGLRLPVVVKIEYPEQMTWGENYTIYASIQPTNKPNFEELLFKIQANLWAEAGIGGLPVPLTYTIGPDIDLSEDFQTPLGPLAEAPLISLPIDLFEVIRQLRPDLQESLNLIALVFKPYLVFEHTFGSQKITAKAKALKDARVIAGENLEWNYPAQQLNFTVNADDYDGDNVTDNAKIVISDFRYYFTEFYLNINLFFDFNDLVINSMLGIADQELELLTFDLSFLVDGLYLGIHQGYPNYVYATIIVKRNIGSPEVISPRDIALGASQINPSVVYEGRFFNVSVTARNLGNTTESFNVTILVESTKVALQTVHGLEPNCDIDLIFTFDTATLSRGTYEVTANATTLTDEIDWHDNFLQIGILKVKTLGDLNNDDYVGIDDITFAAFAFGSHLGHLRWDSNADMNDDNYVGIDDIAIIAHHFGESG